MSGELFSDRLKRYRTVRGISQDEAGKSLGVTGRYIGMIERGDKEVEQSSSIAKLFAVLEARAGGARTRLKEDSPDLNGTRPANSDVEIAGLTALLSSHDALERTGIRKGDLPVVRRALELALERRGVLPKQED